MDLDQQRSRESSFTVGDFTIAIVAGIMASVIGAVAAQPFGTLAAVFGALIGQQAGQIGAIFYLVKTKQRSFADLGFDVRPSDARFILLGFGLQIALTLLLEPLMRELVPDGNPQALGPILSEVSGTAAKLLFVLAIALLAPVAEELLFRGMLTYTLAARKGSVFGLLVGSLVFAVLHATSLSGDNAEAIVKAAVVTLPALFVVGLVLGSIALRFKRLGPSIFTHVGFNAVAVIVILTDAVPT